MPQFSLEHVEQLREALEIVANKIARLPPKYREVFVMSELEGLSGLEVAGAFGLRPNTVYTRVARARRMLRRAAGRSLPG